jgi:hypothetical protein
VGRGGGGRLDRFGSLGFAEKIVRILGLGISYQYSRIYLSSRLRIYLIFLDFTCNLVRILDCDFIVELLAHRELGKTIVGFPPPSPFVEILILAYCMVEK